jgi:predicted DNA binding CopG/RHH family protein
MWVEIIPKSKDLELLPERLVAQSMDRYELRLIIWNTRDIPCIDNGKVDIMVKVLFNDFDKDIEQETDVHNNSKDGNGQFNWRVVIPFKYPNNKTSITVSVFDHNLVGSNEMVASNVINIKKYLNRVHRNKAVVLFPRDWLPLSK